MCPLCLNQSCDVVGVRRRSVIFGSVAMLGTAVVAALLTGCSRGSTADESEAGGNPALVTSEEETRLDPGPTSETSEEEGARASNPAPETLKKEKKPGLDPSAYYDPPTVDARIPKNLTRSMSAPDFPNVTLIDQDGKEVKFYDDLIKGKIVIINFMYATCEGT